MPIQSEIVLAGKFLTESLTVYESQLVETVYPELWGYEGKYHDAIADLPFGALKYTSARMDYTGRAVNFGGKATTIPLANFGIQGEEYKCLVGALAADWTWQELRSAEMSKRNSFAPQVDIVQSYQKALDRGLREWMHIRAIYGDRSIGFTGLINNPYVEVIDVPAASNGVTGTGATAATAYEWFRVQLSAFRKASRLTAEATIAMVGEDVRAALQRRFADNSNDGTPAAMLTNRTDSPSVRQLVTVNEFSGDMVRSTEGGNITGVAALGGFSLADDNFDLCLMMEASGADGITRHFADIDTTTPQLLDDGLTYRQIGLCATSEVIFTQPFRARMYILRK